MRRGRREKARKIRRSGGRGKEEGCGEEEEKRERDEERRV